MRKLSMVFLAALCACGGSSDGDGGGGGKSTIVLAGSCTYANQADQSDKACNQWSVPSDTVDLFRSVKQAECSAGGTTYASFTTGICPTPVIGCCSFTDTDGSKTTTCWIGSAYVGFVAGNCPTGWVWSAAPP